MNLILGFLAFPVLILLLVGAVYYRVFRAMLSGCEHAEHN